MSQISPMQMMGKNKVKFRQLENMEATTGPNLTAMTIDNQDQSHDQVTGSKGLYDINVIKKDKDKIEKLDLLFLKERYEQDRIPEFSQISKQPQQDQIYGKLQKALRRRMTMKSIKIYDVEGPNDDLGLSGQKEKEKDDEEQDILGEMLNKQDNKSTKDQEEDTQEESANQIDTLMIRNKKLIEMKSQANKDILIDTYINKMFPSTTNATSIPISDQYQLQNQYMKNISFSERNFFYIIGNQIIEHDYTDENSFDKDRLVLIVYEYISGTDPKQKLIHQVALNNQHHQIMVSNSQNVISYGQNLYYIKIDNNEIADKVILQLCKYDLLTHKETVMKTNNEKLKGQSYGVCAVFAQEIGNKQVGAKIDDEEKFINAQLVTLVFSFQNIMRYKIRNIKNFGKDLAESYPGTRKIHQIQMNIVNSADHGIDDCTEPLLIIRIKTQKDLQNFKKTWLIGGDKKEVILKEIPDFDYDSVVALNREYELQSLKPYAIYTFQIVQKYRRKDLIESRIQNENEYGFFMQLLKLFDLNEKESEKVESINIVYDQYTGQYTLLALSNHQIKIMVAQDDSVILRKIQQFDLASLHPYSIAANLVKGGVIFDQQYNNIFFRLSKKLEREKFEIHYITEKQKSYFSIDANKTDNQSDSEGFEKQKHHVDSFLNDYKKQTYPRLNVFGDQEVIPNRIYIPSQKNIEINITYNNTEQQRLNVFSLKSGEKLISHILASKCDEVSFNLQGIAESSNVYIDQYDSKKQCQNYQWCVIQTNLKVIEIYELKISSWTIEIPPKEKKNKHFKSEFAEVLHIGTKYMFLQSDYPVQECMFYPIYNDQANIVGTQFLHSDFFIELKNFETFEYAIRTQLANAGYKKYYNIYQQNKDILLLEVKIADIFLENQHSFTPHELFQMLENNMLTLMNMVPIDIRNVFTTEKEYDFFSTLEILKGQSLADTYVNYAQTIHDQLAHSGQEGVQLLPSIIESFIMDQKKDTIRNYLNNKRTLRKQNEICIDFFNSNCIQRCFHMSFIQHQSAKLLFTHMYKQSKSPYNKCLFMSVFVHYLWDQDFKNKYNSFSQVFVDFSVAQPEDYSDFTQLFTDQLIDKELPKFSNSANIIRFLDVDQLPMIKNIYECAKEDIIEYNKQIENMNKNIPQEHFILDFTAYIIQQKLKQLRKETEIERDQFYDIDLANVVRKVIDIYYSEIEEMITIQKITDTLYIDVVKMQLLESTVYIFLVVLPFFMQAQVLADNKLGMILTMIIGVVTNSLFFAQEMIQLKDYGAQLYFKTPKNLNEFSVFFLFSLFAVLRLVYINQGSLIPGVYKQHDHDGLSIQTFTFMIFLQIIVIFQMLLKIIYFFKINESFGLLILLIVEVIVEIGVFTAFMVVWITGFACVFMLIGAEFSNEEEYPDIQNIFMVFFLQTYRNSIGDIATPNYQFWIDAKDNGEEFTGNLMIYCIWFAWIMNQYVVLIILLNFLIAIISQSYDNVMSKQIMSKYKNRSSINRELRLTMKTLGWKQKMNVVTMSATCSNGGDGDNSWDGFVKTIKKFVKRENYEIKNQFHQEIKDIRNDMTTQMTKVKTDLKNEMRLQMSTQMSEIRSMFKKLGVK